MGRRPAGRDQQQRQLVDGGGSWNPASPAAAAAYYAGEDALYQRVLTMLARINGGRRPWQAGAGAGLEDQVQALWCGTAVQPLADRAAKLRLLPELATLDHPGIYTPLAAAALMLDDPRQAVRLRDQAQAVPAMLGNGATLMVITWALLDTGQWDDALEYAGRARALAAVHPEPIVSASVTTAAAYIAACRGHEATAAQDALSVLGIPELTARSAVTARAVHAMGMAALAAGRPDEATAEIRPARAAAASLRCQGLLAADPGPLEEAVAHYRAVGPLIELPTTLEDLAVALAEHGREDDARAALAEAIGAYDGLAAQWDIRRAESRLRAYGIRRGPRGRRGPRVTLGWASLTPTEIKVAALVARGDSTADIARGLFLSRRTVQTYISRILTKLDARSRVEIVAAALREGVST